jgi:hypothetical protein
MSIVRPFTEGCRKARERLLAALRDKKAKAKAFDEVHDRFGSSIYSRQLRESIAADEAAKTARTAMLRACDNESSRIDLPSGTRVIVHAKADPLEVETTLDILDDEIPDKDLEGLDIVRLEGEGSGRTTEVPKPDGTTERRAVSGDYRVLDDGRTIVRDFYPHDYHTIKHEIGHHVFHKLSADRKTRWKQQWEHLKSHGKLPSDYAGKNENEGFAEIYERFRNRLPLDDAAREAFGEFVRSNPEAPAAHAEEED